MRNEPEMPNDSGRGKKPSLPSFHHGAKRDKESGKVCHPCPCKRSLIYVSSHCCTSIVPIFCCETNATKSFHSRSNRGRISAMYRGYVSSPLAFRQLITKRSRCT